jgi:mannose-1-phosphate guanylyltransferase
MGVQANGIWGLVLAGGDGTRLQGLTRALTGQPIPKQYCRITGDRSLLEETFARVASLIPCERTLVVVNRPHLPVAGEQLQALPPDNVLVQPRNCDTGPGLLWSLLHLARRDPEGVVAVFPSDHHVRDERAFVAHLERAVQVVQDLPDKLVLLGIQPDRPEPGLGYVEPDLSIGLDPAGTTFHVAAFHEKPSIDAAERIIRRGGLWNSFVMVFRVGRVLDLLREARPADVERMQHGESAYASLPPWNFSHDFLACIPKHLVVLRVEDVGWSDLGTPEAIERTFALLKRALPSRNLRPGEAAA